MVGISRLGWNRGTARKFFGHTAVRMAWTQTTDADGNPTEGWVAAETFLCDLQERSSQTQEPTEGGRLTSRSLWTAYADHTAPGTAKDKLEINGVEYQIVETDRSRLGAVVTFHLVRLGEG